MTWLEMLATVAIVALAGALVIGGKWHAMRRKWAAQGRRERLRDSAYRATRGIR